MKLNSSSEIYDAIVIGSGPAGSSAAYYLAEKNKNVLILEKESLPRYKTCGGGVVNKVKSLLPINFDEVAEINCTQSEIFDHGNNLRFFTTRENPIILMTMRQNLDYYILKHAIELGAEICDKSEVIDIKLHPDFVEVITDNSNYQGRFVIISNGAAGISTGNLGIKMNKDKLPALEYEVYVDNEDYKRFSKSARFDFDIVRHGYGWVFPKKDHLSIGVIIIKKKQKDLNYLMDDYLKLLDIKKIVKSERHGFFIPINKNENKFAKGRILLTGDAGGFADPVTGEGISHAVESGKIAASSLIDSEFNIKLAADIYNNRINHTILQEIKYAKIISSLVYTYPRIRKILFKLYGQKLSELITDIFIGDSTYSRLLTDPANYLKLIKYLFPVYRKINAEDKYSLSEKKMYKPLL